MMLKKIVAISLGSTLVFMTLLLIVGLFVPTSTLEKLNKKNDNNTQAVALDASGKPIAGATVKQNADGTSAIVDQSGKVVASATSSTTTTASPTTSTTVAKTTVAAATPKATPAPTPAPTPTPPAPAPAPTYCGGKTQCYGRADLAAHSSTGNCWGYVTYSGSSSVYNLTSFAPMHSGGSAVVLTGSNCGKDISASLNSSPNGKHSSVLKNTQATLLSYRVGYYDASKP